MMEYYKRREELKELAFLDEADSYEVDESGIYTDGVKFYLLTASGCSCWDGDYDEAVFEDFDSLKTFLINEDLPRYNPSLRGGQELIAEAIRNLGLEG